MSFFLFMFWALPFALCITIWVMMCIKTKTIPSFGKWAQLILLSVAPVLNWFVAAAGKEVLEERCRKRKIG